MLMKLYSCLLCLTIITFITSARSQGPDKKEPEGFYSQIVRAVVQIEEYRSICTLGRDLPIEGNVPVGSAFFVRDRVSDNEGGEINRVFIVTARHVVEGRADLFARVKTRPDSDETMILRLPRQLWVFIRKRPQKARSLSTWPPCGSRAHL